MNEDSKTRFETVRDLFVEALEQPTSIRKTWLMKKCHDDADLHREVQELLDETVVQDDPLENGILGERTNEAGDFLPAIPGYSIVRRMAVGGQAVVYEATQNSTRQTVAIKVLRIGRFSTGEERARFEREALSLAKVQHAHIVPIIDCGRTRDGMQYLVTQFVDGWPIDKYLDQKLDPRSRDSGNANVLRLFVKIAKAVQFAHDRGVIHRDLKPSNILVDEHGEPRLLDFGLAKKLGTSESSSDHLTIDGGFLGSLPWASPEQARGKSNATDHRSDVYSLGVILYQMLTEGEFPYQVVGNMRDVLDNILNAAPTPPAEAVRSRRESKGLEQTDIHPTIESIVLRALRKAPDDRFQSAGEMANAVEEYLAGRTPSVQLLPENGTTKRIQRIGTLIATTLLIAVAITGLVLWEPWKRRSTGEDMDASVERTQTDAAIDNKSASLSKDEFAEALTGFVGKARYADAAELYLEWNRTHPWTIANKMPYLFFAGAEQVYMHGDATAEQLEVGKMVYRAFVDSHPDIIRYDEGVAGICGSAHVKLGYLAIESSDVSPDATLQSYQSTDYLTRLVKSLPAHIGNGLALSEVHVCLTRQLLSQGEIRSAILSQERNLELKHQFGLSDDALADDLGECALLIYSLAGGHREYERADVLIERALAQRPDNGRLLAIRAIGKRRRAELEEANIDLDRARQLPEGDSPCVVLGQAFAADADARQSHLQTLQELRAEFVDPQDAIEAALSVLLNELQVPTESEESNQQLAEIVQAHLDANEFEAALDAYVEFAGRVPDSSETKRQVADQAILEFLLGLESSPEDVEVRSRFVARIDQLHERQWLRPGTPGVDLAIACLTWVTSKSFNDITLQKCDVHRAERRLGALALQGERQVLRDETRGRLQISLGLNAAEEGHLDQAIDHYMQAAASLKSAGEQTDYAKAEIRAIGLSQLTPWADIDGASRLRDRLRKFRAQGGDSVRIDYLLAMAAIHLQSGNADRALALLTDIDSEAVEQASLFTALMAIAKNRLGEPGLLRESLNSSSELQTRLLYAELNRSNP